MYGKKAKVIVNLLKKNKIIGAKGTIKIELLDTEVKVSDKSSIGNLLQEWLGEWLTVQDVYHRESENTQIPPDFYLSKNNKKDLLEIKTFDYTKSPNFDIANFDAYIRSLRNNAFRLDADYLIFGYSLTKGEVIINDLWLKKVWEITCPSNQYALRLQVKQAKIVNIRPYNFKGVKKGFQPFNSRLEFVSAIKETLVQYQGLSYADEWFDEVQESYLSFAGTKI